MGWQEARGMLLPEAVNSFGYVVMVPDVLIFREPNPQPLENQPLPPRNYSTSTELSRNDITWAEPTHVVQEMNIDFRMNGVNPDLPLLYRILIRNSLCYIGCANSARRPQSAYGRNLQRMINGTPYRKNKPEGFRLIHKRMLEAVQSGEEIVIELIRNVSKKSKFSEERAEIARCRLEFGDCLLNGTTRQNKQESEQGGDGDAEEAV